MRPLPAADEADSSLEIESEERASLLVAVNRPQTGGANSKDRFGGFVTPLQVGKEGPGLLEGKRVASGKNAEKLDIVSLRRERPASIVFARIRAKHRGQASRREHEFCVFRPAGVKRAGTNPVGHLERQARNRAVIGSVAHERIGGVVVVVIEIDCGAVFFPAFRRLIDLDSNSACAADLIPDRLRQV